jgi:predicted nucleic acid-binding protein
MSAVLVDSNIILDIVSNRGEWSEWSSDAIARAGESARLVINPVIYAEVSIYYSRIEDLDRAIPQDIFAREPISYAAAFLGAKAFLIYQRRGGTRTSPLPDFFIGAHAAVSGYRLITRDAKRYRTYFPEVQLITPNS